MKAFFIRREDYWMYPLSIFGVFMIGTMLYAGAMQIRLFTGLAGFCIFYFMTYILRKNYGKRIAASYLFAHLLAAVAMAATAYFLTN